MEPLFGKVGNFCCENSARFDDQIPHAENQFRRLQLPVQILTIIFSLFLYHCSRSSVWSRVQKNRNKRRKHNKKSRGSRWSRLLQIFCSLKRWNTKARLLQWSNKNTLHSTKQCMSVFKSWAQSCYLENVSTETMSPGELEAVLTKFYAEVKENKQTNKQKNRDD